MKFYYSLALILLLNSSSMANKTEPVALLDIDLTSLGDLQFYTASRTVSNVEDTPAVVTVITQEEIKRRGYRTLHDALSRVTGFFPSISGQAREQISNRGYSLSGNRSYLLLIDGHSQNTVTDGLSNAYIAPTMDFIKRIEIIRGPGSTLWGNSAIAGIIHIITKSAADIDTKGNEYGSADVTLDYELEQKRQVQSLQYGKKFENGNMMISLTRFDSDAKASDIYKPTGNGIRLLNRNLEYDWTSSRYSVWDFKPSHDLYLKANYKDFSVYMREADMIRSFPWFESYEGDGHGNWNMKRKYIDLRYHPKLSENISLETRAFYNNYEELDTATLSPSQQINRGYIVRDISYKEKVLGGEVILKYKDDTNSLLGGVYYEKRKWDKSYTAEIAEHSLKKERNSAIFIEDTYVGIKDFSFTLGGRLDRNSVRSKKTIFLPKVAVIYRTTENTTLKYIYNSGYSRPAYRPDNKVLKPEGSDTHDLQFSYWRDNTMVSVTLFHNTIQDNIVWDGTIGEMINGGDIIAKGIEVEGSHKLNEAINLYANYSYAEAKFNKVSEWSDTIDKDGRPTGVPKHTYNIGADYNFFTSYNINLNLRGWSDAVSRYTWARDDGFMKFGHEYFVDFSFFVSDLADIKDLEANLYIKNLLNNDNPYPDAEEGGYVKGPHSRLIGLKMSYRF